MMKEDKLTMTGKERQRYHLLRMVMEQKLTLREASGKMGVSYRHAKRMKARFRKDRARGLVHGNRGRASPKRLDPDLAKQIRELSRTRYARFNDTHFTEKLREVESILVSRETVRRLRRSQGKAPKRKRRPRKHFKRRPRKVQEGMMLQWDGSPHRWFGRDREPCCLMSAIDDATGKIVNAFFVEFEGTWAYLHLLRNIVEGCGIPVSIYQDRHGCLHRNDDNWSVEEELAGRQTPTQVGMALDALGIEPIYALTPQAKGRVENRFNTLQDRLVAELDLADIHTIDQANAFLRQHFIDDFNRRFALPPEQIQPAWRPVPKDLDLERTLAFLYYRTVGNDNAVRLQEIIIDIPPGPRRRSYAKALVEVRQLLDGSWRVYYKTQLIARTDPTPLLEPLRARQRRKPSAQAIFMASAPTTNRGHNHVALKGTY